MQTEEDNERKFARKLAGESYSAPASAMLRRLFLLLTNISLHLLQRTTLPFAIRLLGV